MKFSFRFSNLLGSVYQGGNVEFTPDGNVVASAVGNKLSLFDLKNHCSETLPVEAQYSFSCLSISPNGRTLIAVSEEGRALLIDILARRILHEHRLNHKIPAVKFSPNGRLIAFVKDNGVLIYRAPNISVREYSPFGLERIYQGCYAPSVCVEWSSDSRFLAIGAEDGRITVFPVGKCTQFGIQNVPSHNVSVRGCFFAEKSLDFYSVAENGHLCVWECTEDLDGVVFDNELPRKEVQKPKKTAQEENDEDDVISESEEKEEKEPGPFERKAKHLYKRLARHYLKDLVKNADGKQITSAVTTTASYHRRTRMLVTGFSTGDFFLHEMPEANLIHSLNVSSSSPLSASAFSPSGEWLALACKSRGQLVVWEWQSESFILKQEGRLNSLSALAYSADGQYVATGGDDGKLKIWSVITGFCVVTFTEHTSGITGVVYGPGGRTLVSSSLDGTVRAFDTARYRNFRTLTTPTPTQFASVTLDPAGEFACASGMDKFDVYVWSIKTGRLLEVLAGHEAPVSSVFISPAVAGDTVLASCSWDGTLKVWRFLESTMAAETIKLTADATCCVVRPDGVEVAVATLDGVIAFFDISTARQTGSIEGKNDLGSGRKDADLITSKTTGDNKCFTTLCYSSDGNFILAAGQSKHVCIYHVGEGLLAKKFSITRNRSLDAMTEFVNKRRMTELGSLAAMGTRGQGEEFGEGRLALPGVKAGDMASRTFRPEVRVSCVRFAPNGRSWAATTTEGIMVYSLDRNLTFDPYLLEEKVTPARITETIREQEYGEAVMLALRLNEEASVIEALESTPPNDIDIISRALPSVYVVKLLDFLSQQLGRTAHLEFYLMWVRSLLWAHSLELKRTQASKGEFAGTVRNLMRNLQRKLTDLGKICDHNKYLTSYLMQVHRCKKERELARDVKKEEELEDAVVPVAPEFDDDLGVDVLMDDVET